MCLERIFGPAKVPKKMVEMRYKRLVFKHFAD